MPAGERSASNGFPVYSTAIRILNLAEANKDPIAKVVLAVSAIEGLATDPPWTDEQRELIDSTAAGLQQTHGDGEGVTQVREAIRQIRKESIRQRIRKLLQANNLSSVWHDWDGLYTRRSGLFHGRGEAEREHRGRHLEESTLHALGQEAIKLSAKIVLSIAKREGIPVPSPAKVHFGVDLGAGAKAVEAADGPARLGTTRDPRGSTRHSG